MSSKSTVTTNGGLRFFDRPRREWIGRLEWNQSQIGAFKLSGS
jgi:hypothetical protein